MLHIDFSNVVKHHQVDRQLYTHLPQLHLLYCMDYYYMDTTKEKINKKKQTGTLKIKKTKTVKTSL